MNNMFVPKRIKIGFQKRVDTFNGTLSYITYFDVKGKLRKETSWNGWRDHNIDVLEFDNVPQNNYILNKGIQRDGYWGSGRSVIRVYDPREFEFEISVDNLMGILMHSDVSKRDIVEQCVFAWKGSELVLLPVNSKEDQSSVHYTNKQDKKISSKELVEGYTYQAKKLDTPLIYIGQREWFDWHNGYEVNGQLTRKYHYNKKYITIHESKGKKYVFYDGTNFITKTPADLSAVLVDQINENYAFIVDQFFSSFHSQKVVGVSLNEIKKELHLNNNYFYFLTKEHLIQVKMDYDYNGLYTIRPKLRHIVYSLSYPSSIKMISGDSNPSVPEFESIMKEFNSQFKEYVDKDIYTQQCNIAIEWLSEHGVKKGYNLILENGKEVLRSH